MFQAPKNAEAIGTNIPLTYEVVYRQDPPYGETYLESDVSKVSYDATTVYDWYNWEITHFSNPGVVLMTNYPAYGNWRNDYIDTTYLGDAQRGDIRDHDPPNTSPSVAHVTISAGTGGDLSLNYTYDIPSTTVQDFSNPLQDKASWRHEIDQNSSQGATSFFAYPAFVTRVAHNYPTSVSYYGQTCYSEFLWNNKHCTAMGSQLLPYGSYGYWRPGDDYYGAALSYDTRALSGAQLNMWTPVTVTGGYTRGGFAPSTIQGGVGETYILAPQDYQSWQFDHWENGSTQRTRQVTANSATSVVAYFRDGPPLGTQTLTINSQLNGGGGLTGMYTVITQAGVTQATGWTPMQFNANTGQMYTVSVSDYGTYYFDHWENGSTTRERNISLSSPQTITAFYRTTPNPPPSGPTVTVNAQRLDGSILNMYTTITQNGATVATGFTPMQYGMTSGTYVVTPSDYTNLYFDHWDNGSTVRSRSVSSSASVTITAYYRTTP